MIDPFFVPVLLGGVVAGASTGTLGVYIVGMRMPFLGVCVAHSALAGAVFGVLAGLSGPILLMPALVGAVATALLLGLLDPRIVRADSNILMGVLFSLSMGLAFLGIGLIGIRGQSDNEVRNLLWGSLAFCQWREVWIMLAAAGILAVFVLAFAKEMRAVMFCRTQAAAAGVHVTLVWTTFLILVSVILTVNFQTVGGLMIYSLLVNPAAAAFQLTRGHARTVALAAALGGVSGAGGFAVSAIYDLPTGAVIVLFSSALVLLAAIFRRR